MHKLFISSVMEITDMEIYVSADVGLPGHFLFQMINFVLVSHPTLYISFI